MASPPNKQAPKQTPGNQNALGALTLGYAMNIPPDSPLMISDCVDKLEWASGVLVDEFASGGIHIEFRHGISGVLSYHAQPGNDQGDEHHRGRCCRLENRRLQHRNPAASF